MKIALSLIIVLVFVNAGYADNTGSDIYQKCKVVSQYQISRASVTRIEILNAHYCMGMVNGISGILMSFSKTEYADVYGACFPTTLSTADLALSVVSYINRNPEILNYSEGTVVMKAIMQSYPCK